ncbi:MAG TPA: hypothetical protein VF175_15570 [Lacipirellula sp.]
MRRIAYLFLGLLLTVGMVGCEGDTATDDATTTTTDPATDPATDADADGDVNAADEAPADPAAE